MQELTAAGIRDLVGESPLFIEAGANDGTDTLEFLQAMPGARIYCFEPDLRAIARFKAQVKDDRVTLHETAVGDFDGVARFYGSSGEVPQHQRQQKYPCHFLPEWDLSGSLRRPTGHLQRAPWVTFPEDRQSNCVVVTLDTWLVSHPEVSCVDFMWVDVQGGEDAVIRGGHFTLRMTRYFYTEFSDTELYDKQVPLTTIKAMLPDFECLGIYGENALFRNRRL